MNELIIFGAGDFGSEVAWLVERINKVRPTWKLLGFIDDNILLRGTEIYGYKVLGDSKDINRYSGAYFVCAIGVSKVREKIIKNLKKNNENIKFAKIIDPSVLQADSSVVGEGSIVCANTILSVGSKLGEHVIINFACTIGHDVEIQNFATVFPGVNISGFVSVGHGTELGTGMQIIQGKRVGAYSIVGAGAVVIRDIPEQCTAVGNPAKKIR